jgi:hypothetical protein
MTIAIVAISAWAAIMLYRMYLVGQARDQAHRERLAMIEKGITPPPANDLEHFERMTDWHPSSVAGGTRWANSRRTGIILIAVGIGQMVMFYLMNQSTRLVGIGVMIALLGLGFLVISMFERSSWHDDHGRTPVEPPRS